MTQVLIYENATPVSSEQHRDLSIEPVSFEFASKINAVPLTAVEIPLASREYTIVFSGNEEAVTPMVILGIDGKSNLYLDQEFRWKADYIPTFIRRYPFLFSRSKDQKQVTLCVDEHWAGCNREDRGQRLFDDEGNKTKYTENMLKFLSNYQQQFSMTQAFSKKLQELDVLESMQANVKKPDGQIRSLRGFYVVSREKLKALAPEKMVELINSNMLELAYLQMASMNNLHFIVDRFVPKNPQDADQEG